MILAELEDRERVRELSKPMPDSKRNDLYPVVEDPHAVRCLCGGLEFSEFHCRTMSRS